MASKTGFRFPRESLTELLSEALSSPPFALSICNVFLQLYDDVGHVLQHSAFLVQNSSMHFVQQQRLVGITVRRHGLHPAEDLCLTINALPHIVAWADSFTAITPVPGMKASKNIVSQSKRNSLDMIARSALRSPFQSTPNPVRDARLPCICHTILTRLMSVLPKEDNAILS